MALCLGQGSPFRHNFGTQSLEARYQSLMIKYPVWVFYQVQGEKKEEITAFTSETPLALQDKYIAMLWRMQEKTPELVQ